MASPVSESSLRATCISMLVITSLFAVARLTVSILRPKKFSWEDGFLLAAYVFFLVLAIVYTILVPLLFKLNALAAGELEPYEGVMDDILFLQKMFFVATPALWLTLWSVKLSLMSLYKRLMTGIKLYERMWWVVIVLCVLFLAGAITSQMLSCSSMKAWFTAGACGTARDIKASSISLWYAFAVDVLTDLLIMLLPLGLIWRLQMPLGQKIGIWALFCIGWVCIVVAIIRVKDLGSTVTENSAPSTIWLALRGTVEAAIAVIIGCCPGLHRIAKAAHSSRTKVSYNNYNNGGYARHVGSSGGVVSAGPRENVMLSRISAKANRNSRHWNDANSSQEELAGSQGKSDITVTKDVTISVHEADPAQIGRAIR